ncbi:MAG: lasso peptide biosynthesis B2 protein [Desulfitobacteriaceae bacterium]
MEIITHEDFHNDSQYTLADDVILIRLVDGTGRLLKISGNSFLLPEVSMDMLCNVLEQGFNNAIEKISVDYQITEKRAEADLKNLINTMLKRELIVDKSKLVNQETKKRFLLPLITCMLSLLIINLNISTIIKAKMLLGYAFFSIKLFGLTDTIYYFQKCFKNLRDSSICCTEKRIKDIEKAVRIGTAGFILPVSCKESSLCCSVLLGAAGIQNKIVLGIRLFPMSCHAWCTHNNVVIADTYEKCKYFKPFKIYDDFSS